MIKDQKNVEFNQTKAQTFKNENVEQALRIAEGKNFVAAVWFHSRWATTNWDEDG